VRFASLTAGALCLLLAPIAFGQQAAPAQNQGRGVGQGLAPPPDGGQQGARGQNGQAGGRGGRGQQVPAGPAGPTPRWPDGKPRLGAIPGQRGGLWNGGGSTADATTPYQPWAKAVSDDRRANAMEPHTRCKPSGGPRQFATPYGVEILEMRDLQRVYIFDNGGPHTFRTIYTDGRAHPADLTPSYYGHSVGRWEGDTFIVDSVGFNEKMWIDRGQAPHTEKLHIIEKFTRTDMNSMTYELTVEDPGAYTATWSRTSQMRYSANAELFEFICQDNNLAPELLVGTHEFVDRSSVIVP
jgi:hypothetical protein